MPHNVTSDGLFRCAEGLRRRRRQRQRLEQFMKFRTVTFNTPGAFNY